MKDIPSFTVYTQITGTLTGNIQWIQSMARSEINGIKRFFVAQTNGQRRIFSNFHVYLLPGKVHVI